jgi:hypothetical protein
VTSWTTSPRSASLMAISRAPYKPRYELNPVGHILVKIDVSVNIIRVGAECREAQSPLDLMAIIASSMFIMERFQADHEF